MFGDDRGYFMETYNQRDYEEAEFFYKVTDFYHPNDEGGIKWDDPDIGIDWPLEGIENIILSDKDKVQQSFSEYKGKI